MPIGYHNMGSNSYSIYCPLCLSSEVQLKGSEKFFTISEAYKKHYDIDIVKIYGHQLTMIRMYECSQCHLVFFQPYITGDGSFYLQLARKAWYYMPDKWEFNQALDDISPTDIVLEIGCGNGSFLKKLKDKGIRQIVGIDLNVDALREPKAVGVKIYNKTVEELAAEENQKFDVVCSFQVLENVSDPRSFLEASIKLLKPGGKLIMGIPNSEGFMKGIRFNLLDMPPHHVTRWSINVILYLDKILPLRVERYSFEPIAEYHVDWYARNRLLNYIEKILGERITNSLDEFLVTRKLLSGFSRYLFLPVLSIAGTLQLKQGHTLYVKYRKEIDNESDNS
ncbi:MAG: methyltransferase domain-containing protein [Alphaproteobacteria bacterium]|nr:MAG: methyltransferase domain-containing protein [Alphaproteobacteria bacterium]